MAYVLLAAMAFLVNADPQGTQMGNTHRPQVYDFTRAQTKRCTRTYKKFLADNNFIKGN